MPVTTCHKPMTVSAAHTLATTFCDIVCNSIFVSLNMPQLLELDCLVLIWSLIISITVMPEKWLKKLKMVIRTPANKYNSFYIIVDNKMSDLTMFTNLVGFPLFIWLFNEP